MAARAKISLLSCALALVVAGCGSGGDGTIPPESSDRLLTLLAAIEGEISGGECDLARQHADEFVAAVEELPSDVDSKVADELTTAADNLDQLAGKPDECTDSGASGPEGVEPATSTPTTTEEPETTDTTTTTTEEEPTTTEEPEEPEEEPPAPSPEPTEPPAGSDGGLEPPSGGVGAGGGGN